MMKSSRSFFLLRNRARSLTFLCSLLGGGLLAGPAALAQGSGAAVDGFSVQPLAPRSQARGATLFTRLSAEETGIRTENNFSDPEMWGKHYQELVYGEIGTGIAVGDYDNDGRPDLFVVSKTEESRLFRNLGNWKFEDATAKAGLKVEAGMIEKGMNWLNSLVGSTPTELQGSEAWKQCAIFADVNNDGFLDLYVTRFGAANLLYINQRDGTFKNEAAERGLALVDSSGVAAFCDYDRDGALDLYLQTSLLDATTHPKGQRDRLFHNDGTGKFTDVTDRAGIAGETEGHSATWWDYDGDGWPDLYVANDYGVSDSLYHNNRDGTFIDVAARTFPHLPYYAMGSDLGDVNNDGLVDFFVADMAPSTHEKDQRGMAGSRSRAQATQEGLVPPQYMRNALYINEGAGRMIEAAQLAGLAATDWTWSVRLEDLDNDGRLDVQVTNGMTREYHNADLLDRSMGAENPLEARAVIRRSPRLAEANLAYRNRGDLSFEDVSRAWGLDEVGVSFGAAFGDFDGDGDLDLVYANYEQGVTILRNDSPTGHRLIAALQGTTSNRFGIGAKVRIETAAGVQVRELTLARGYLSNSEPVVHFGLGGDERVRRLEIEWPGGKTQVFQDLAVDRKYVFTEPAGAAGMPSEKAAPTPPQWRERSAAAGLSVSCRDEYMEDRTAQPLLPQSLERRGPGVVVADLNGDGADDVVLGATRFEPAQVVFSPPPGAAPGSRETRPTLPAEARAADTGTAQRSPSAFSLPPSALGPLGATAGKLPDGPLLAFDADGDGALDLLVTKSGVSEPAGSAEYQPQLHLGNGHGGFRAATEEHLPKLSLSAGAAVAADFNRDGWVDVFIGGRSIPGQYPLAPDSVLLVNRGGRFEDVTEKLAPALGKVGLVTAALWTDVDDDGWLDLLVAVEWGTVRYFHNREGQAFDDWSVKAGFAAAGSGWWTSLAAADFNGDGRLDYVAGNVGLNTPYQADAAHPVVILYGEFSPGMGPLLVEAYQEGNRLLPRRTRKDLAAKIPALLKRYPKNDTFARATLEEILGAERVANARRFEATEFHSGVFLSQPDGGHRFEPLPRIAQVAPLQGLVAGDFDGDGRADIATVQNSYAPIPAVGHFDGGLGQVLTGDGKGHFRAVPAGESGLVVPGDAKGLALLDRDGNGWPDFLATRNNATTLFFANSGVRQHRSFAVRLHGSKANPAALGARVEVRFGEKTAGLAEVYGGSGYWSQSAPELFFGDPGGAEGSSRATVTVRWPSGKKTEHTFARPLAARVDISER